LLDLERGPERFDLVLCGDVLEHLVDPWTALRCLRALCPNGYSIVSLPNVAHVSTFIALLRSHWPYRERGIHDRTHLRFFGRNNLSELYQGAGFREVRRRTRYRLLERPSPINERLEPVLGRIPVVRRFLEYQFISLLK
jgi:2-polyprenyl-3-methyl-5-hydroxy-6-metoxy-1,4-benzoquinol methylase